MSDDPWAIPEKTPQPGTCQVDMFTGEVSMWVNEQWTVVGTAEVIKDGQVVKMNPKEPKPVTITNGQTITVSAQQLEDNTPLLADTLRRRQRDEFNRRAMQKMMQAMAAKYPPISPEEARAQLTRLEAQVTEAEVEAALESIRQAQKDLDARSDS